MERLCGNFWIHDPGDGSVAIYERIGRNFRPVRAENEPLPDRIPFEAQKLIRERLAAAAEIINAKTPREVRLNRLTEALALFPAFQNLSTEDQNQFLERMSEGIPETFVPPVEETQGLPRQLTIDEQVEAANKAKALEIDKLDTLRTENMRLAERLAILEMKEKAAKEAEEAAAKAAEKVSSDGQAQA